MKIAGSVALVTGGASGLGLATVRRLHDAGASVVILDLPSSNGTAIAKELGARAAFAAGDVTSPDDVEAALDAAAGADRRPAAHPGQLRGHRQRRADRGQGRPVPAGRLHPGHPGQPHRDVQRDPAGRVRMSQAAEEDGERGVIVNTASVAAFDGQIGQAAYSASKGGIVGMTLPIARDLARLKIRVMTIAPGLFQTPLLGGLSEEQIAVDWRAGAASGAAGPARRVRRAGRAHRGEPDAQRGDDPAGRRDQDGPALADLTGLTGTGRSTR